MGTQPLYVPILKGKEGEYAALEALRSDARALTMPLIEVPGVPYDYANERPAKELDEHVSGIPERLKKCWTSGPLYLQLPDERLKDGRIAMEDVLAGCARLGVSATPVISRKNSREYVAVAGRYSARRNMGCCIRLTVADFGEAVDIEMEVERLFAELGNPNTVDLILDMEDVDSEANRAVLVARSIFSMIPQKDRWRQMILAAASFPEDLSDVGASSVTTLPRHEWDLWKTLQRRPASLPRRTLIYGDYAIAHPVSKELDPRMMRMSASIRYTTPDNWLVVKGRNVRQYGFDQYFELCKALVERPEFCGPQFSWGDKFIDDCANGMAGPGNATTWRKVGTNHHITLVARELAKMRHGV